MKRIEHIEDLERLWPILEKRAYMQPDAPTSYSDATGYHIYADLQLRLEVAAAQDAVKAMKCVDLLEDFTSICNRCANIAGIKVLEIQGERVHFILPAQSKTPENLKVLIGFSVSLTRTIDIKLRPLAGEDWRGFSMAADFGRAVLIGCSFGGGSVVSLGNAANQPAKKLGRGVTDKHLALPEILGKHIPGAKKSGDWFEIDVFSPTVAITQYFSESLNESMSQAAGEILELRKVASTRAFVSEWANGNNLGQAPYRTRGMCLRADLDGFTKRVEEAFKAGRGAIELLITQFTEILEYPREFANKIERPIIEIPWAGDCANVLILPRFQESVETLRSILPIQAGRLWHGIARENGGTFKWDKSMGKSKWAIGLACGDEDEGGNGYAIVAEFAASNRIFRVLVGWCSRRAKDAQEADGNTGDDVVIPFVDWQNLETAFAGLFEEVRNHPSYRRTNYQKIIDANQTIAKSLTKSTIAYASGVKTAIPAPRPHSK